MAVNNKFEVYKVKREIKRSGKEFDFFREDENSFGEKVIGSKIKVFTVNGLYYEHNAHILDSYLLMTATENGEYRIKRFPQIMCITDDVMYKDNNGIERCHINVGDFCYFSGRKCRVTGVKDFMEWGMVCTISFEAIDYGSASGVPGR